MTFRCIALLVASFYGCVQPLPYDAIEGQSKMIQLANKNVARSHLDLIDGMPETFKRGIFQLLEASDLADDVGGDPWDFALEIATFHQSGVHTSQLRWLLCKGLAEHVQEKTACTDDRRTFTPSRSLYFTSASCFLLTRAGRELALQMQMAPGDAYAVAPGQATIESTIGQKTLPLWDCELRELRLSTQIIKRYRVPSPNQLLVLATFEEEGWPCRVDDPLPPHPELDPKRRLHDTIKSLNRHHVNALMRFYGDGTGEGVRWGYVG